MTERYRILCGDVREQIRLLPDESVHTACTSPPYFGQRDYGHASQIGNEETLEKYVQTLVEVFREVRRVMRHDATLWLNLGDAFSAKQLLMVPARVALALQEDGWLLRQDIIWAKANSMPESVTDRPSCAHEHIFLLAKFPTYFYDAQAIAEPMKYTGLKNQTLGGFEPAEIFNGKHSKDRHGSTLEGANHGRHFLGEAIPEKERRKGVLLEQDALGKNTYTGFNKRWDESMAGGAVGDADRKDSALYQTRNKRSVWTVPTFGYAEAHFATFPPDLIKPCILAGTSEKGCCSKCGAQWYREVKRTKSTSKDCPKTLRAHQERGGAGEPCGSVGQSGSGRVNGTVETVGWSPTCKCNADIEPCTVLDPFLGSGTTLAVALYYNRNAIGIELNPEYCKLAENRIAPYAEQEVLPL